MGEEFYTDVLSRKAYSVFYQREATVIFQIITMSISRDDCFTPLLTESHSAH